jgi:SMC interacting uncharacterized protein involved in chromosome segregation
MNNPMFWLEIGVGALIAFGATFFGVYFSFKKESSRRQKEQKEQFTQMVLGLMHECSNNKHMLDHIREVIRPGTIYVGQVSTDTLQSALSDPLFHRWASSSLVLAATTVKSRLAEMNNILSDYRQRGTMASGDVERLRIRAEKRQEAIVIMQELLQEAFDKYGGATVTEKRDLDIAALLGRILTEEREQTR